MKICANVSNFQNKNTAIAVFLGILVAGDGFEPPTFS